MPEHIVEQELDWQQQRAFDNAYEGARRKLWLAYFWALLPVLVFALGLTLRSIIIFLGFLGLHRFYLGRNFSAAIMMCLWQGGFVSASLAPIFLGVEGGADFRLLISDPMMLAACVWLLIDLVGLPFAVRRDNRALAENLRKEYATPAAV